MFDLTYKENFKITREAMTPIVDLVKLCTSKYSIERSQRQCQCDPEVGKSDLTNFGDVVKHPGKINLQASILMIQYLIDMSFELWMV